MVRRRCVGIGNFLAPSSVAFPSSVLSLFFFSSCGGHSGFEEEASVACIFCFASLTACRLLFSNLEPGVVHLLMFDFGNSWRMCSPSPAFFSAVGFSLDFPGVSSSLLLLLLESLVDESELPFISSLEMLTSLLGSCSCLCCCAFFLAAGAFFAVGALLRGIPFPVDIAA